MNACKWIVNSNQSANTDSSLQRRNNMVVFFSKLDLFTVGHGQKNTQACDMNNNVLK